eukprot:TRINITY_DN1312_c0_g1_i11.p2 TRINITY_DN1312_c0_g1~~TRINITY_DN1312_c0_g1_i11.p2  ORF type:complete len:208 (-),score=-20.74 TRINITY_DN1312_c0_g1_i11:401-1024(-)
MCVHNVSKLQYMQQIVINISCIQKLYGTYNQETPQIHHKYLGIEYIVLLRVLYIVRDIEYQFLQLVKRLLKQGNFMHISLLYFLDVKTLVVVGSGHVANSAIKHIKKMGISFLTEIILSYLLLLLLLLTLHFFSLHNIYMLWMYYVNIQTLTSHLLIYFTLQNIYFQLYLQQEQYFVMHRSSYTMYDIFFSNTVINIIVKNNIYLQI